MIRKAEFGNVHTTSVENGRNTQGNLPSADAAAEQSTAVKSARRAPGSSTDIGALKHSNELRLLLYFSRLYLDINDPTRHQDTKDHPLYPFWCQRLLHLPNPSVHEHFGTSFSTYIHTFGISRFCILHSQQMSDQRSPSVMASFGLFPQPVSKTMIRCFFAGVSQSSDILLLQSSASIQICFCQKLHLPIPLRQEILQSIN
jgi:hypothetical protein